MKKLKKMGSMLLTGITFLTITVLAYAPAALAIATPETAETPEPATMLLLGAGVIGLVALRKKIKK